MTDLVAHIRAWLRQRFGRSAPSGCLLETLTFTEVVTWFQQPHVQACVDAHLDAVGFTFLRGPGNTAEAAPPEGVGIPIGRAGYPWVVVQGVFDRGANRVVKGCVRVVHARSLDDELLAAHQDKTFVIYS